MTPSIDSDETQIQPTENAPISCLCSPPPNGGVGRNLIVSIDGTANQFGMKNTNIVELYSRLVRDETQLTYYNSGIGTYVVDSKSWLSLKAWNQSISHNWDKAFATNFKSKVLDAYEWLSENYRPGDKIFLFGFSRGAYQVRVIAGMIEKVGLIHKGNKQQIPFAYDLYTATLSKRKRQEVSEETPLGTSKQPKEPKSLNVVNAEHDPRSSPYLHVNRLDEDIDQNIESGRRSRATTNTDKDKVLSGENIESSADDGPEALCQHFKRSLSNNKVRVHFVGAWDTVSSVGILRGECLPETTSGMTHVCAFRHALALDELRVKFLPEYANGGSGPLMNDFQQPDPLLLPSWELFGLKIAGLVFARPHARVNPTTDTQRAKGGNVKEVWFAGSHSDIGGGNVKNLKLNQFGPSLRWMTYEALTWGLKMNPFDQKWAPLSPKSSMNWKWNILENLPILRLSYQNSNAVTRRPHRQSPRLILPGQLIHESVYELIKSTSNAQPPSKPYLPMALLPGGKKWASGQAPEDNIIEKDPYLQPDRILEAIKEKRHTPADFDVLLTLSSTAIGQRSIRERPEAEETLASVLASQTSNDKDEKDIIHTISRILDRCFNMIPVEFISESKNPYSLQSSVWETLDKLYPEGSSTNQSTRLAIVKQTISLHMAALEASPQPPRHIQIASIKELVLSFLNLLVLTIPDGAEASHRQWLYSLYKEGLRFDNISYKKRFSLIECLAGEIQDRFEMGQDNYLNERVLLFKRIFDLRPPDQGRQEDYLLGLLPTLYQRFEATSRLEDIDEIVSFNPDILRLLSDPDHYPAVGTLVAVLALSYLALFKTTGDLHHIDEAAMLLKESISNCGHTDSNLPYLLDLHGYSFHLRFQQTGHHIYLDKADNAYRSALEIRHTLEPQGTYPSIELAAVLCDRYKLSRHQKFLDDAIQYCRDSLALCSSRPRQRDGPAFILAEALMARYKVLGKPQDLEDAISLYQEALDLNPPPYFRRAICLNALGGALTARFHLKQQQKDVERAVVLHREALAQCLSRYFKRDSCLSGLAAALTGHFIISGEKSDLEEAISHYQNALDLLPSHHFMRSEYLFGLANTHFSLFKATKQTDRLNEAITLYRGALKDLPPSHIDRADLLYDLAIALQNYDGVYLSATHSDSTHKAQRGRSSIYGDEVILLLKESLQLRRLSHHGRANTLRHLISALLSKSGGKNIREILSYWDELTIRHPLLFPTSHLERRELDMLISLLKLDLEKSPAHHERLKLLRSLWCAFLFRFGKSSSQEDLVEAFMYHKELIRLQPPMVPLIPDPISANIIPNLL
ncbi:hypothetical protein JR316_0002744 [Psilocybe cubensis]|uniref:Uncharacterized protein n=1 Tax=Psilocybe cubensis TaxID=181762 RepID=A0ACB8HDD2_PSICU|nr:hypothetical protein JR316_0002744 [Psilocybe cubensis]KAH9485829.1 hypothetical protein JR316_0002744 [Psilocybe cubensis]